MDHEYQSSYILLIKSFMFVTNSCNRNLFKKASYVHRHTIKINKIKDFFYYIDQHKNHILIVVVSIMENRFSVIHTDGKINIFEVCKFSLSLICNTARIC